RLLRFDRTSAARYSFLLSIPAVVLSGLFELRKVGESGGAGAVPTAIATLLAFVVGYASIAFLLRWLTSHSMAIFVAYRVGLGASISAAWGAAGSSCAAFAGGGMARAASRSCTSRRATTAGWCRPATAGRPTWPVRSASPPTRRPPGGAVAAWAPSRTG